MGLESEARVSPGRGSRVSDPKSRLGPSRLDPLDSPNPYLMDLGSDGFWLDLGPLTDLSTSYLEF